MPQGPCYGWARRLRRGSRARSLTEVFISVGCRGRAESHLVRPQAHTFGSEGDCRADYGAIGGAAAPRGEVLSFGAKESTKESTRHGDYGKKASIAHFVGGARYVARTLIGKISLAIVRAPNSPFSAVKMGGPFSLRCLSPLVSAAAWVGAKVK